jgi:hypothetical protein
MRFKTWSAAALLFVWCATALRAGEYFEIQVLDEATGRGVPLVELKTTNHLQFVTDSAGRIAFFESELMDREVYFGVTSHGYEFKADGFGFRGARLTPKAGARAELKIKRTSVAERLYRITGEGIYRDTELLGKPIPVKPQNIGLVGQDSAQVVRYADRLFWFFGDTSVARYPLGVFRMTGATSDLPKPGDVDKGIHLKYFTTDEGHPRAMIPLADEPAAKEGVVWIDGVAVVPDQDGKPRMVGRFERLRGLGEPLEQGICTWNDERQIFERTTTHPMTETRLLKGAPIAHREQDVDYIYCGLNVPTLRVRATLSDVMRPDTYEAWTCLDKAGKVVRDADGRPQFSWRKNASAWTVDLDAKHLRERERQLHPRDVATDKPIRLHHGSVRFNKHRQKWIAICSQQEGTSYLGEVWYSEADAPTGPWRKAVKIVTHDKYSFYNPVLHDYFDDGSVIYFQGTYAHTFSGNTDPTPRYDYNQLLYRLDLDDPRLAKVRE